MKTTYINPELSVIEIDREISLRMQTTAPVLEPGSGAGGIGGEGNGSGESNWDRSSQQSQGINAITPLAQQQQQNQMPQNENSWQNFEW